MIWGSIPNFPKYVVSNTGEVANIKNYIPISKSLVTKNHTTYARVTLFKDGIRYYKQVHRLVAEVFCSNPNNYPEIDHKDTNGLNNDHTNLEWVTRSINIKRSFKRNNINKLKICSKGGSLGGLVTRKKAEIKYKEMLLDRFIEFHPSGSLITDAAITYLCFCGVQRTVSIMMKELRVHKGKCPKCTNTVNRSTKSLR